MANGPGDGSISKLRNGRYWVRSPLQANGKRLPLGTFATYEEARAHLETFLFVKGRPGAVSPHRITFARFALEVLDLREEEGIRGIRKERDRFRYHLAECNIAAMPLTEIGPHHIAELLRQLARKKAHVKGPARRIDRSTVQRCKALVSAIFTEAVERGLMPANPCTGVRVKKRSDESKDEPWEYLTPDEQHALITCPAIPYEERVIIRFAMGTGLRQGELHHNLLKDLHVDGPEPFVFVRYGSKNKPPKSGKTRRVPLFGDSLVAAKEWLDIVKTYRNPEGLIFPTKRGYRRQTGKTLGNGRMVGGQKVGRKIVGAIWEDRFAGYVRAAGITKHFRWHDLRHTCGSSLVAGWWGRKWSLEEIKELMGHSSIIITQRYAHLGDTSLKSAARETAGAGYALVTTPKTDPSSTTENMSDFNLVPPGRVELPTNALGIPRVNQSFRVIEGAGYPPSGVIVTSLASTYIRLVRSGQREAALAVGVSLASAVLDAEAITAVGSSEEQN